MTQDPSTPDRSLQGPAAADLPTPNQAAAPEFATQHSQRKGFGGLSTSMKALIITVPTLIVAIVIAIVAVALNKPSTAELEAERAEMSTVADDTHYLDKAGDDAPTLVEFLDFECEVCARVYPFTEEVRETYKGKINYAVRYFPLAGHFNSMNAAVAVEAAAQQGKYEEMYHKMFETRYTWGDKQVTQADAFRGFAEELGLDLAAYDAAVADPATEARVKRDYDAAVKLGATGTPTFYLDGKELELGFTADLTDAIDAALAKR